jgi:hypothetical protein
MLEEHYDRDHEVVLYLAAQYASCDPMIERVRLSKIPETPISNVTTLYVPPRGIAAIDYAMLDRLGIPRALVRKAVQRNSRKRSSVKGRSRHTRNSQRTKISQEQGRT